MLVNVDPVSTDESHETVAETCEDVNSQNRSTRTERSCLTVTNVPASVFTSDKVKVL